MPRRTTIKFLRTTKTNLDAQKAISNLIVGEPYLIRDAKRFAIAYDVDNYITFLNYDDLVTALNGKANTSDVYTKTEIDGMIGDIETLLEAI